MTNIMYKDGGSGGSYGPSGDRARALLREDLVVVTRQREGRRLGGAADEARPGQARGAAAGPDDAHLSRASPPRPREEEGDVAPPRPREDEVICLDDDPAPSWTCRACTFLNEKPHAPVCAVCETAR